MLKTLFLLKDCLEASIKYLGCVMLVDYPWSSACMTQRVDELLDEPIRPALGIWANDVVRPLSIWLAGGDREPGRSVGEMFTELANSTESAAWRLAVVADVDRCRV